MDRSEKENRNIAYHEAGHAVAAYACGRPFRYVTIVESGDAAGGVGFCQAPKWFEPEDDVDPATVEILTSVAVGAFAGPVAAERISGVYDEVGASSDEDSAKMAISLLGQNKEIFVENAKAVIDEYWPAVEAVAQELIVQRRITAAKAREIMAAVLPQGLNMAAKERAAHYRRLRRRKAAKARQGRIFQRVGESLASGKKLTLGELACEVFGIESSELKKTQLRDVSRALKRLVGPAVHIPSLSHEPME